VSIGAIRTDQRRFELKMRSQMRQECKHLRCCNPLLSSSSAATRSIASCGLGLYVAIEVISVDNAFSTR
jgi:hypothetical protein